MENNFTKEAQVKWDNIPKYDQDDFLSNVWCGSCGGVTTMVFYTGKLDKGDLILTGTCEKYGNNVARLIEAR